MEESKKWWTDESQGGRPAVRVWISTYQYREWVIPNYHPNVRWDSYECEEYLRAAGIEDLDKGVNRAFKTRAEHEGFKIYDEEMARQGHVLHIYSQVDYVRELLTKWIDHIKQDDGFASGDDCYYDYDTDQVEAVYQLARAIEARGEYEDLLKWIKTESPYADDEGEVSFPEWEE